MAIYDERINLLKWVLRRGESSGQGRIFSYYQKSKFGQMRGLSWGVTHSVE
jgi:hypothetical protein